MGREDSHRGRASVPGGSPPEDGRPTPQPTRPHHPEQSQQPPSEPWPPGAATQTGGAGMPADETGMRTEAARTQADAAAVQTEAAWPQAGGRASVPPTGRADPRTAGDRAMHPGPTEGPVQVSGRASVPTGGASPERVNPGSPSDAQGRAAVRPPEQGPAGPGAGRAAVPTPGSGDAQVSGRAAVPPVTSATSAGAQPALGSARAPERPGGPAASGHGPGVLGTGPRRSRRTLLISVFSALVLLAGAAGVLFVTRPGPVEGWLAADPTAAPSVTATPEPIPTPVLMAADTDAVAPSAAGVRSAVAPLVTVPALGSRVNVSIVDAATGEKLFERNPDAMTTPASTTKLVTAATVLAARGPAYRLTTRAVAGARPGEVVLVGGGDPTLAVNGKGQFPGAARLDRLAAQVRKALGGTAPTRVLVDTSMFTGPATGKGWSSGIIAPEGQVAAIQPLMTNAGRKVPVHNEVGGDPRFADPALAAGQAFAKQLGVTAAVRRGKAPPADASAAPDGPAPGAELGKVASPPLVHVVDWMLEQSDNVLAEVLSRQVALAAGRPASFDGASAAMIEKLRELGLETDEIRLADASGLSRNNAISPSLLTDLLALAASGRQPALSSMFAGLPVAGWSGTLRTRFATPAPNRAGQGLVRAKTGSLTGVNTISGQLVTRDVRLLAFAIMADRTGDSLAARAALDRIAARLVACGC